MGIHGFLSDERVAENEAMGRPGLVSQICAADGSTWLSIADLCNNGSTWSIVADLCNNGSTWNWVITRGLFIYSFRYASDRTWISLHWKCSHSAFLRFTGLTESRWKIPKQPPRYYGCCKGSRVKVFLWLHLRSVPVTIIGPFQRIWLKL